MIKQNMDTLKGIGNFIGTTLTYCRKKCNMTQTDLSLKSGIPTATISNIEQKKTEFPNVETLTKLTTVLNIPVGLFLLLAEIDSILNNKNLSNEERFNALETKNVFEGLVEKHIKSNTTNSINIEEFAGSLN